MQPLTKHREVTSEGVTESVPFTISIKDQSHIKSILRDTLYSDKILAALREYSANAWDAHRMAGKPDLPIKVQLPTLSEPNLIIEDYGIGLSHEDVFQVFAQYGASTKRGTNDAVGMLGIGSKSGFSYSDTFTIVSRHGGKKRTYVALLDESENDAINLLNEVDHDPNDIGLTIQIAVRQEDIFEFERKAQQLFQHFNPRPVINTTLPEPATVMKELTNGLIYDQEVVRYGAGTWHAVMGCVPYKIDLAQLRGPMGSALISESFSKANGLIYCDIGEIQINASREALKYSDITKKALVEKFNGLLEEYVRGVLEEIESTTGTNWDKRLKARGLVRLGLGEDDVGDWGTKRFEIRSDAATPAAYMSNTDGYVHVGPDTRLVLKTGASESYLQGYKLTYRRDILIAPSVKGTTLDEFYTWEEMQTDLDKWIKDNQLEGIPIVELHTLPWEAPVQPVRPPKLIRLPAAPNPKHKVSTFKMTNTLVGGSQPRSANWEIEERVPEKGDVFVIMSAFSTDSFDYNIYECRKQDQALAEMFKISLPAIYGYKTTAKKPRTPDSIKGIHYPEWRKKFLARLPVKQVRELLDKVAWSRVMITSAYHYKTAWGQGMVEALGAGHPVAVYYRKKTASSGYTTSMEDSLADTFQELGIPSGYKNEADTLTEMIRDRYPLLKAEAIYCAWTQNAEEWVKYIQIMDKLHAEAVPSPTPEEKDVG